LPTVAASAPGAFAAQTASHPGGLQVAEGGGSSFPARSLVLSVPSRSSLSAAEVHVSENGQTVDEAIVTPIAKASAGDFGIVLAIDTSPSMQGRSLQDAMAAARALAGLRTGEQYLSVVEFNQVPKVVLPLTADGSAVTRALAGTPPVGGGTHIFDALATSIGQLQSAHVAAGAVILLSDGADRGSTQSEQEVAAAARAAHISLFTVGVRDAAFDASSLSMLARDGGGQFVATDSSGLKRVFTQLAAGLVSRYVVHYSSRQPAGHHVTVRVSVAGTPGAAVLDYSSPQPPRALAMDQPKGSSFWTSTLALLAVSVGAALLLGLTIVAFLRPRVRQDSLRGRVGRFTASTSQASESADSSSTSRLLSSLEHLLERTRWWSQFKADVEIANFERPAVQLVVICVIATVTGVLLFAVGFGIPVLGVVVLFLGPLGLVALVRRRLRKQRAQFSEQLPDHLQELASTMRAGHSLVSGIAAMAKSASEPSRSEWARVVADEQLGMPLEAALVPLSERMDCSDVEQVALVAALQQRSGGNMAEVLERLADGVRERADLRRELDSLTAQARLSRWVVTALPPAVLLILTVINPHYVSPLFHSNGGQVMLGLVVILICAGSVVMRRITDIRT
jgi:tight adherence protein B